jgi:hypothetical protein
MKPQQTLEELTLQIASLNEIISNQNKQIEQLSGERDLLRDIVKGVFPTIEELFPEIAIQIREELNL